MSTKQNTLMQKSELLLKRKSTKIGNQMFFSLKSYEQHLYYKGELTFECSTRKEQLSTVKKSISTLFKNLSKS